MRRILHSCLWMLACAALAAGCGVRGAAAPSGSTLDQAAAEATTIIQSARATALLLQAQTQATALVAQAGAPSPSLPPTSALAVAPSAPAPTPPAEAALSATGGVSPLPTSQTVVTGAVELVSVGFGADGGFLMVQFRAPPREAQKWWQGSVSVENEGTGVIYNEIPVMPVIGPLIGRPRTAGQLGYVMLVNAPPGLRAGALVTVVLGSHKFEHVPVH